MPKPKIKIFQRPNPKRKVTFILDAPPKFGDQDIKDLLRAILPEDIEAFHDAKAKVTHVKVERL